MNEGGNTIPVAASQSSEHGNGRSAKVFEM
jgi:hypothetical protein